MRHNNDTVVIDKCMGMLIRLLIKNGALEYFISRIRLNAYRTKYDDNEETLLSYCKSISHIESWVDKMGHWASTKQGHAFWYALSHEFADQINGINSAPKQCKSIW